jgi:predicted GIY-YIG superfamily endonuclease
MENPNAWHVYQLHGDAGLLLYVGYSRWLKQRLAAHRRTKPWWPEVTNVQAEEFATEDEARQREKEIWAGGQPRYNQRNPFRTQEETRRRARAKRKRSRERRQGSAEALARKREYNRMRDQTPERRNRANKTSYRKRPPQQTGPGLF